MMQDVIEEKCGIDVAILGSKRIEKQHICKFCGKIFNKAQALGGHTSKLHSEKPKTKSVLKLNKKKSKGKKSYSS